MRLTDLIPYLVEELTPGDRNKALRLNFDVRLGWYKDNKTYNHSADIELLFRRDCGHFDVFSRTDPEGEWRHTSSHDSEWKTDGLRDIDSLYFKMARETIDEVGDDKLAPKDLSMTVWFRGWTQKWYEIVDVEVSKDPSDFHGYKKIVKIL